MRGTKVKYGTLSSTLHEKSLRLLSETEKLPQNRNPSMGNMKIENCHQTHHKPSPKRYSMKQPRYLKNIEMPMTTDSNHQTSIQPW